MALHPSEAEKLRISTTTGYNEMQSAARKLAVRNGAVKNGIDLLEESNFAALKPNEATPRKIGLLTNQTGMDSEGRRTLDVLSACARNFAGHDFQSGAWRDWGARHHGRREYQGCFDRHHCVKRVWGDDAARRPAVDDLKKLDAVVIDLQDVGVRYYTYETTVGYFLEAAAKAEIEVIVLDRPNPITGSFVQGPVSDVGRENYNNYFPVPVRHGMTLGELAKMFNVERGIGARLTIVPAQGWQRGDWFDSTGLQWINPSPNMRSLTEATLYPGVALIEGTNVSVGRGTDTPFEVLGAPWIRGKIWRLT